MQYLQHAPQEGSGFADWGSLCHSIFEDYAKGNLAEYEMLKAYCDRYGEYMENEFPPCRGKPMEEKYCERGKEIFASFTGFHPDWEILGVEQKIVTYFGPYKFIGYIDLLVRDVLTGSLIIIDHKSKSEFKTPEEQKHYAIQPYLYSKWVYETYGEYPAYLIFNMFRVGKEIVIPFSRSDYENAKRWLFSTIDAIYNDDTFLDKIEIEYLKENKPISEYKNDDFFCKYLCGSRKFCKRSGLMEIE